MPIKKSTLEKSLLYRIIKICFLIIPLIVIATLFFKGDIVIPEITQKNLAEVIQKNIVYLIYLVIGLILYYLILKIVWRGFLYLAYGGLEDDTVKKGSVMDKAQQANQVAAPIIVLIIIIVIVFLFQTGQLKMSDLNFNKKSSQTYGTVCTSNGKSGLYGTNGSCITCSGGTAVTSPINSNCSKSLAGVYCCGSGDNNNNNNNNNNTCIPTGCGKYWRCDGSYYIGNQQISVHTCLPMPAGQIYSGWTGTCRQCP